MYSPPGTERDTMEVIQQLTSEPHTAQNSVNSANQSGSAAENVHAGPRLCRFYSQGRYCQFGKRCRFLHQYVDQMTAASRRQHEQDQRTCQGSSLSYEATPKDNAAERANEGTSANGPSAGPQSSAAPSKVPQKKHRNPKVCHFFASGYCAMDNQCRFWHPEQPPPVGDSPSSEKSSDLKKNRPTSSRPPVNRPSTLKEEMKLSEITPEVAQQLRETEISQLMKRFTKDKVIVQEREDGKVTYYRISVQPTDPDWPYDLKEMDIMVCFPEDYPLEVFSLTVPEDQELRSVMGRHVCQASEEWLQAKFATNRLIGKVELLFRPYLHWLDRNMERLFTEAARMLKRDIDAEKAGIEFVSYQQLQAAAASTDSTQTVAKVGTEGEVGLVTTAEDEEEDIDDSDSWVSCDEEEPQPVSSDMGISVRRVEEAEGPGPRKGTEIRFIDLHLGEGIGTLVAQQITVSLKCNRCKINADLTMSRKHPYTAQCEKCSAHIGATFHPSMLHQYSSVVGHLDLRGVAPVDLVLQDCVFVVCCLSCSQEGTVEKLSYGQSGEINCQHCHSRLTILTEAARFQNISFPRNATGDRLQRPKKVRDPAIQFGKPLPGLGTCQHYGKSFRWLRFPCCGKAYPCDRCHNEAQVHEMELASRMICGYCAKEQPYSNGKPCIACANMMTRGTQSHHWEGGQGCRNKIKMSRKDKQKHANSSKTISRRTVKLQKK